MEVRQMGGKVGGLNGGNRPVELEKFDLEKSPITTNRADTNIKLATPVDERPAHLSTDEERLPGSPINQEISKTDSGYLKSKLQEPPGLDKSGPGNSENAPGHNKFEPPPPP